MERKFSPCTRLHDLLQNDGLLDDIEDDDSDSAETVKELNLNVSTEELLSAEHAFTYADLHALLGNRETVVWLTPYASVVLDDGRAMRSWKQLDESCHFRFSADGKDIVVLAHSHEHLLEICDVVLRLLAVSSVHSLLLADWTPDLFIDAPTLAYMMEQCQSLKTLKLRQLKSLNENHCRVLGDFSRPGLKIILECCKITSAGASALAEVLGRSQGPTNLTFCDIDNFVLANGLRGNSNLKILRPRFSSSDEIRSRETLAIAGALRENKGLVDLDLMCYYGRGVNSDTWGAICDSLKGHPTLEVLHICSASTPARLKSEILKLVDMMKVNMSIHTIHLDYRYTHHELFRESVIPYVETNRFRPRLLAIQKTRPITYRAKVLGRALLSARTDANSFWMLLSGNAEVAFPSSITTIAAAAYLPTPGTAVATTTATGSLPTAAATAATSAATPSTASASDALAFAPTVVAAAAAAAANVATPSVGQKRKTCP
jgi:hypothetical protein